jgi:DNA-binding transcriptional LysR family regulator
MEAAAGLDLSQSFIVVAEELNFRRSAERLHHTREVLPTPTGRAFYEENVRLLQDYERSVNTARLVAEGEVTSAPRSDCYRFAFLDGLRDRPASGGRTAMQAPSTRDLQAFMAIAEELSFRRAAERLYLDQSALSRRVQNLEEQLGFRLIFRTTREVELTEAGRVFYEEVAPAMRALARAPDHARVAAEGKTGRLRLAYMSFAATELLPESVRRYTVEFPDVALSLAYLRTQAQKLALSRGEIDAGFMLGPFENPQYDQISVSVEPLIAVVPIDHWLSTRPSVTLNDLAKCKLILGSLDQWDFFRLIIDDIFTSAGLSINVAYEPSNTLGILGLVAGGLGVAVYVEGLKRFQPQRVIFKPIEDCKTQIETILCWSRRNQSPALRNFVGTVRVWRRAQDPPAAMEA